MSDTQQEFTSELNFLVEFHLSRRGMIEEIKTEFDIIRLCYSQYEELGTEYKEMIDRILVMPLRKLLCEKNSVLLQVCPMFKMPPLNGRHFESLDKLHLELAPYSIAEQSQWITVEEWLKQIIAYYDKDVTDLPSAIPEDVFQNILNKLNRSDKAEFETMFIQKTLSYSGDTLKVRSRVNPDDSATNQIIYNLMDQAGYYKLTVYNFIKHLSDKRGAHIDVGTAPLIQVINGTQQEKITPIVCMAAQLLFAAKRQIPELLDYWPEMPDISQV